MSSSQLDVAQIANVLGLTPQEVDTWKVDEKLDVSAEGVVYGHIIEFAPDTPRDVLDKAGAEEGEFFVIISDLYEEAEQ